MIDGAIYKGPCRSFIQRSIHVNEAPLNKTWKYQASKYKTVHVSHHE